MADNTDALQTPESRATTAADAGETYNDDMEGVMNDLDAEEGDGITIKGTVKAGIDLVEAESKFNINSGVPKTASKAVKTEAGAVKRGG